MSVPCVVYNSSSPAKISVLQLQVKSGKVPFRRPWQPDTAIPFHRTTVAVGLHHCFHYDVFELTKAQCQQGQICYRQPETRVRVRVLFPVRKQVRVGILSGDCVWTQILGVLPDLRQDSLDVVFHVGNQVYMDPLYSKFMREELTPSQLLAATCNLYIQTWARIPMHRYEHRIVVDDHEWVSRLQGLEIPTYQGRVTDIGKRKQVYFQTITPFLRQLCSLFNGPQFPNRSVASYQAFGIQYLAYSNWGWQDQVPKYLPHADLISEIEAQVEALDTLIVIFSQGVFDITRSSFWDSLCGRGPEASNRHTYKHLARLRDKCQRLVVVCGDLHFPVSFQVSVPGHPSFEAHAVGTLTNVVGGCDSGDFNCRDGVKLQPIRGLNHLSPVNSYLRFDTDGQVSRVSRAQSSLDSIYGTYQLITA